MADGDKTLVQIGVDFPGYQPLNGEVLWVKGQDPQLLAVRREAHELLEAIFDGLEAN